jgi:hypothetical protein
MAASFISRFVDRRIAPLEFDAPQYYGSKGIPMQTNTGPASDSSKKDSLALGRSETTLQAFEYASWHLASAFARWRRDCLASLVGMELSGSEASMHIIIPMGGRPKALARFPVFSTAMTSPTYSTVQKTALPELYWEGVC